MRRTLLVIGYNAAASILLIGLLEACSRLAHPVDLPAPLISPGGYYVDKVAPDAVLFWVMRPNLVVDGRPLTNSLGLRGPEIPAKEGREFRILSLGESTTFARRLLYSESYSSLLERSLGSVHGKRVRVINAGVPAYTLFQGATYLRERGFALKPDAVLIYFGYNDFLPASKRTYRPYKGIAAPGITDRQLSASTYRIHYVLAQHSNLFRILSLRRAPEAPVEADPETPRVPESDRRLLLAEIQQLCRAHGARLIVVIPWYREFEDHTAVLREFGAEAGVAVVDLPERLSHLDAPRESYFVDRVHPTAPGHRLIAREIETHLREIWDLPPRAAD